jgi:hypothetical protein
MGRVNGDVPEDIVRAAMAEPTLRGRVILSSKRRVPLLHDGVCVGFVTPHETKSGWRAGPIYVVPGHRGHGHVEAFYAAHPERAWVAFVAAGNRNSLAMHKRAGFEPWKAAKDGQWMKREATK